MGGEMKTKLYTLTFAEACVIRDALMEEFGRMMMRIREEDGEERSLPYGAQQRLRQLESLKDQFKTDCRIWKE
jgi:hypothetical protein